MGAGFGLNTDSRTGFDLGTGNSGSGLHKPFTEAPTPSGNFLLLESGDYLLLESGDKIILEN